MIKNICKEIAPYNLYIQYQFLGIQLVSLLFSTVFSVNLILIDGLLMFLTIAAYLLLKDLGPSSNKDKLFNIAKWTSVLSFTAIINDLLWAISGSFPFFKIFGIFMLFLIPVVSIVFLNKPHNKEKISEMVDNDFWASLNKEEIANGDVQVGINLETNKPMILRYHDRFVHMLVLGPTGSGKTSQILIPMIFTDLKNHELGTIVMEPKDDLAEKVYALSTFENRKCLFFNPVLKNCPYFNPLRGDETDVIENIVTTFRSFDSDTKGYFADNNENLLRRGVKVVKRLYQDDATLNQLDLLINNVGGIGTKMLNEFAKMPCSNMRIKNDNDSIISWFTNDYFSVDARRTQSKTFEATSGVRNQLTRLISNAYLNKVLNPPPEKDMSDEERSRGFLDFDEILANGEVCAITSAQGKLKELGNFLGFFLILQIQSSVFRRGGTADTRRGAMLYIDEFQEYANPGFSRMLTQGRSYRVGCILATQGRAQIGMNSGSKERAFTNLVGTNARNVVVFPGANSDDANYFMKEFGEVLERKENVSISRKKYGLNFADEKESIRVDERYEARFRASDVIYGKFGEALIRIIDKNTVQKPVKVRLDFIAKDINDKADEFIADFKLANATTVDDLYDDELLGDDDGFFVLEEPEDLEVFNEDKSNRNKPPRDSRGGVTKRALKSTPPIVEDDSVEDVLDTM